MRLLASTDYALRVLMLLARRGEDEVVNVETLSRELGGLSRHHLHKIVQDLTALGVTRTVRGIAGGVALAQAPGTLRVGALVRQLESRQNLVACFAAEGCDCTLQRACGLRGMLHKANERFYATLDEHTLVDCLTPPPAPRRARAA